mmetsp:Transcript_21729/g.64735  ORF Transcript_21729/g.64735 Transcript_21729/m.64735 type:complete len:218 (+) Transcript_21729:1866-2519(+)
MCSGCPPETFWLPNVAGPFFSPPCLTSSWWMKTIFPPTWRSMRAAEAPCTRRTTLESSGSLSGSKCVSLRFRSPPRCGLSASTSPSFSVFVISEVLVIAEAEDAFWPPSGCCGVAGGPGVFTPPSSLLPARLPLRPSCLDEARDCLVPARVGPFGSLPLCASLCVLGTMSLAGSGRMRLRMDVHVSSHCTSGLSSSTTRTQVVFWLFLDRMVMVRTA